MKFKKSRIHSELICVVCGHESCRESSDHQTLTLRDFSQLVNDSKKQNLELDEIISKTTAFYQKMKEEAIKSIEADCTRMLEHLNMFFYPHIDGTKVKKVELSSYANGCYDMLPNKKIVKLVHALKSRHDHELVEAETEFEDLKNKMINYFKEFEKKNIVENMSNQLPHSILTNEWINHIPLQKSLSEISNPEEVDEESVKTYSWKNITLKSKTKVLGLSNKNISDEELLREMPIISSFKNIQDVEIRNNRITSFSCKLIANNMRHVKVVDIRGNQVGDEGVTTIIRGIPHMKSFMISETKCTNVSAEAIVESLQDLEILWAEHNQIDDEHSIAIAKMPKIKMLSLAGNGLDPETMEVLKKLFNSKGCVIV